MGNSLGTLTPEQKYLYGRYPYKQIFERIDKPEDEIRKKCKKIQFKCEDNFSYLSLLLHCTSIKHGYPSIDVDRDLYDRSPYDMFLELLDASNNSFSIEMLALLVKETAPDNYNHLFDIMPKVKEGEVLVADTGIIIPTVAASFYTSKSVNIPIVASADYILEKAMIACVGFESDEIISSCLHIVRNLPSGVRFLDLDTGNMVNKTKWTKMIFKHEDLRIATNSELRLNTLLKMLESKSGVKTDQVEKPEVKKYKRKPIPAGLRSQTWDQYCGRSKDGTCFVCEKGIAWEAWHAGHVLSDVEGGPTTLDNLRPICIQCNLGMGRKHMYDYMFEYYPKRALDLGLTRDDK